MPRLRDFYQGSHYPFAQCLVGLVPQRTCFHVPGPMSLTWRCCKCGRIIFRSGDMNFSTPIEIRCCHITYTFFTDSKGSIRIAFGERGLERGEIIPEVTVADVERVCKGSTATKLASVPFKEEYGAEVVWEGTVEVFHLHPTGDRCYSWFIDGQRYFTILPHNGLTPPTREDICQAFLHKGLDNSLPVP